MVTSWRTALDSYDYSADLAKFKDKNEYPGGFTTPSFQAQINRANTRPFEDSFRKVIEKQNFSNFSIIGEVCFWKIYTKEDPHSLTTQMLNRFKYERSFRNFCLNLRNLAERPTLENFNNFRIICGQPHGFAVPITFLCFFRPNKYPMADSVIAHWWCENKERFGYTSSHDFLPHGMISGQDEDIENNWNVYHRWMEFCQKYASILTTKTQTIWRARDVEMAVFYNCQKGLMPLNKFEDTRKSNPQNDETVNKKPDINWTEKFNDKDTNYAPKQYPYWSTGAGPKQNVYRKNK